MVLFFFLDFCAPGGLINFSLPPFSKEFNIGTCFRGTTFASQPGTIEKRYPIDLFEPVRDKEYWPWRLLHLPSMTSVERVGQASYPVWPGSGEMIERPRYAVLSYTWGRYEIRERNASHSRLKISGLDWDIPAVHPKHFTVESFEKVLDSIRLESRRLSTLNKLGGETLPAIECDFVWLDIACIHQTDTTLKASEIARQGQIFRQAKFGFIWATETSSTALTKISTNLEALIDLGSFFKPSHTPVMERALESARELIMDPWFSSLWTLQESQLRKGARVISSDGSAIVDNPLLVLVGFEGLYLTEESAAQTQVRSLVDIIRQIGYSDQEQNPNVGFSAARHRVASLRQDCVYATMSLYDLTLRIERFKNDPYAYAIEDLEYAFASALCKKNPGIGQFFVHTLQPKNGITWQLTQNSRMVAGFRGSPGNRGHDDLRIIATERGFADFSGHVYPLASAVSLNCRLCFDIDEYLFSDFPKIRKAVDDDITATPWDKPDEGLPGSLSAVAKNLMAEFPESVLLLRLRAPYIWERSISSCPCVVLRRKHASLPHFERLGICFFWGSTHGHGLEDGYNIDWTQVRGKLF